MSAPATPRADGGDAHDVRRRQLVLFSVLAAVALVLVAVWLSAGSGGGERAQAPRIEAELAGPGTAEDAWTRRSEARLGGIEARLREMESDARALRAENERLRGRLVDDAADARAVIDRQAAVIEELARAREAEREAAFEGAAPFAPEGGVDAGPDRPGAPIRTGPMIERFELAPDGASAAGAPFGAGAKPLDAWLPAGAHAEAVVLAGVDASAGVSSQGDPRPVLLRMTGPAWTAAEDGEAMSTDIEGCTVTGAAHGDLSSEKVYVRLRTMTCRGAAPGTVVETEVAGFVAGSGKTGVRGPVVSREGALVEKAFLAGLVSGVGQGVARAFAPQAVATGDGASVANTGLGDIGRAGLGAGAASAGGKVADYMIRRAEQYQPVIQLRAGTRVSVVFLEGARLGAAAPTPNPAKED